MILNEIKQVKPKLDSADVRSWFITNAPSINNDKLLINERYHEIHMTDTMSFHNVEVDIPYYFKLCGDNVYFENCNFSTLPFDGGSAVFGTLQLINLNKIKKLGKNLPGVVGCLEIDTLPNLTEINELPNITKGKVNKNFSVNIQNCPKLKKIVGSCNSTTIVIKHNPVLTEMEVPLDVNRLVIRNCHKYELDFNKHYEACEFLSYSGGSKNLKGIHKSFPNVSALVLSEKSINGLGIFKLKDLDKVYFVQDGDDDTSTQQNNEMTHFIQDLVYRRNKLDLFQIQEKLIDAGYEDFAKL